MDRNIQQKRNFLGVTVCLLRATTNRDAGSFNSALGMLGQYGRSLRLN